MVSANPWVVNRPGMIRIDICRLAVDVPVRRRTKRKYFWGVATARRQGSVQESK
jgi:hypothetical protein